MNILIFDSETNAKLQDWRTPPAFHNKYPFIIDLAWILANEYGEIITHADYLIRPQGWTIPKEPFWIEHGYSTEENMEKGEPLHLVLDEFTRCLLLSDIQVAHNFNFDKKILQANYHRYVPGTLLTFRNPLCTMQCSRQLVDARDKNNRRKAPQLKETYFKLFGREMVGMHRAKADTHAVYECFFELVKKGIISLENYTTKEKTAV